MLLNCLAKQIRSLPSTFTASCRLSTVAFENTENSKSHKSIYLDDNIIFKFV